MHILKRASGAVTHLLRASTLFGRPCNARYLNEEARDRIRALKPGDQLHGYTVQRVEEVPDFFITAAMLSHDKTGAEHLHAARDDDNNTFSAMFRTTPMDSTGVPHILEHTVLCGSQKFPIRDPFFKMLSRSMATFMNALTAYDWTMYPFSSQNQQDFNNLMSVYMDAVFHPLIRELDFCQEGWRLEQSDLNDPESPIVFKGVVYNEMKGVFSNSQSIYQQEALNSLLPSHTYGVVSGGDPAHIPKLTYKQLAEFHATHYHPSNAKFFTYGNMRLEKHLEFISSYLEQFDKIKPNTEVPKEPRWKKPRSKTIYCPPDPMAAKPDKQTTVSVSFLLSDITDIYEEFVASVMGYLLTSGETSPFYRALLETDIGSDFAPTTGFHGETREAIFSVGLSNISKEDEEKVLKIIDETIDKVIEEGFEKTNINALLHRIELSQRHESSNFGFNMAVGLSSIWNHGGDPVKVMQVGKIVEKFREDLKKNPKLLQKKVKEYLKENPHRLTLTMHPDSECTEKRDKAEQDRLSKLVAALTDEDKEVIHKRGLQLQAQQDEKEDLSCLPSLKVSDISKEIKKEPVEFREAAMSFITTCVQPTNGVIYLRMASNLGELAEEFMPYVPLFADLITKIGTGEHDYLWMSQQQELYTGGFSAAPLIIPHHTDPMRVQRTVLFSSYCLEKNVHKMMELWGLLLNSPDFSDTNRLSTLIRMSASDMASQLADNGHQYAISSASSTLDISAWMQEMFSGYKQCRTMKQIAEMSDLSDIVYKLQCIADIVLDKTSLRMSLNATPSAMDKAVQNMKSFLGTLKGEAAFTSVFPEVEQIVPTSHATQYELPFSVNYVARSFPAVRYTHRDFMPLNVLATLMSRKFLHREIREKGGAYGSGAQVANGIFSFYSYRDPRSLETLEVFDKCIEWASKGEFTEEDLNEAKLGVFQRLDKPVTPGNRGQTRFIFDISEDQRQKNRDRLFAVSADSVKNVVDTYLNKDGIPSGVAFLGPANEAVQKDSNWLIVKEEEQKTAEKEAQQ